MVAPVAGKSTKGKRAQPRVGHAAWLLLLPLASLVLVFSMATVGPLAIDNGFEGARAVALADGVDLEGAGRRRAAKQRKARLAKEVPWRREAAELAEDALEQEANSDEIVDDADGEIAVDSDDIHEREIPLDESTVEIEGNDEALREEVPTGKEEEKKPKSLESPSYVLGHDEDSRSRVVAEKPRSWMFTKMLTAEEADGLVALAAPSMLKSTVVDSATGKSVDSNIRTSSGTFLTRGQNRMVKTIEEKIANFSGVPVNNGEGLQILHYTNGQKYEAHYDYFHDKFNTAEDRGGQRLATVLMYLSDVEKGGETVFPHSSPKPAYNTAPLSNEFWSDCAKRGAAVKPAKGDALLFFSLDTNNKEDPSSLHAGCPVIEGEKWSATKWMHVHEFGMPRRRKKSTKCEDANTNCAMWATQGECESNPGFMLGDEGSCRKSCKECH